MPRRPLLAAAATLSTLTLLTACNGSPEAGRPNTTPTSTPSTPTPTPSAPSGPAWTPEQQAAITAATTRYKAATAAMDRTFMNPSTLNRSALAKAGIGEAWIITIVDQARTLVRSGLYQTGTARIAKTDAVSVKLEQAQPEVRLTNCVDSSKQVIRFKKDGKPVPVDPNDGTRHKLTSRLVLASPAAGGQKMWFLMSDEDAGPC